MRTSRPFSTIFHGSKKFLEMQLREFERQNKLTFWAFVFHHAEEDEKKDHFHVFMVPDGQLDTASVTDALTEFDVNNVKPIKPLPFQSSKFGDWYLYSSHNVAYLLSKGQTRKYHYSLDDFVSSSEEYLIEMVHTIDMSKINRTDIVKRAVEEGVSFCQLVSDGQIPIQQIGQYEKAYDLLQRAFLGINETIRGNYRNHEEVWAEVSKTASEASITASERVFPMPKTYNSEAEFEVDAVPLFDVTDNSSEVPGDDVIIYPADDDDLPF